MEKGMLGCCLVALIRVCLNLLAAAAIGVVWFGGSVSFSWDNLFT